MVSGGVSEAAAAAAARALAERHIRTHPEWLPACLEYVSGVLGDSQARGDTTAVVDEVLAQYLVADLCEIGVPVLPAGAGTLHNAAIAKTVLQVHDVREVGEPLMQLWAAASDALNTPVDIDALAAKAAGRRRRAAAPTAMEKVALPRRMLKVVLSDGSQEVVAMEYRPCPALDLYTPLGTKILIHEAAIRRGTILLEGSKMDVLGGPAPAHDYHEMLTLLMKRFEEELGMEKSEEEEDDDDTDDADEEQAPSNVTCPPTAPNQNQNTQTSNPIDHHQQLHKTTGPMSAHIPTPSTTLPPSTRSSTQYLLPQQTSQFHQRHPEPSRAINKQATLHTYARDEDFDEFDVPEMVYLNDVDLAAISPNPTGQVNTTQLSGVSNVDAPDEFNFDADFDRALAEMGPIDLFGNDAAIPQPLPADEFEDDIADEVLQQMAQDIEHSLKDDDDDEVVVVGYKPPPQLVPPLEEPAPPRLPTKRLADDLCINDSVNDNDEAITGRAKRVSRSNDLSPSRTYVANKCGTPTAPEGAKNKNGTQAQMGSASSSKVSVLSSTNFGTPSGRESVGGLTGTLDEPSDVDVDSLTPLPMAEVTQLITMQAPDLVKVFVDSVSKVGKVMLQSRSVRLYCDVLVLDASGSLNVRFGNKHVEELLGLTRHDFASQARDKACKSSLQDRIRKFIQRLRAFRGHLVLDLRPCERNVGADTHPAVVAMSSI